MSTLAYNFASGGLFAVRNDAAAGATPTPVKFGALQDVQIDFSGTIKDLIGQYQFPVDVARGAMKITGKAKAAQIYSSFFDLFFGVGVTGATGLEVALNEAQSVPGTSTYTITATNHTTYSADLGVSYAATGIPLTRVAGSSEALGKYSVATATGIYTFSSADASAAMLLSYEYTGTSGFNELAISNQLMGTAPTFSVVLATTYKSNVMNLHLNQCISEKLMIPVKNSDYTIMEFDFAAYADAAGNLAKLTTSQ